MLVCDCLQSTKKRHENKEINATSSNPGITTERCITKVNISETYKSLVCRSKILKQQETINERQKWKKACVCKRHVHFYKRY